MKKFLLVVLLLSSLNAVAAGPRCRTIFSIKGKATTALAPVKPESSLALPEVEARELKRSTEELADVIKKQEDAFFKFAEEYGNFQKSRWLSQITDFLRNLSGNSLESAVRMQRVRLGDRFYRIMRAGDTVRATNYVRSIVSPVRTSAQIIFWARAKIMELEASIKDGQLTESQKYNHYAWIAKLQKMVRDEAPYLARYGDMQMIVYQLIRLRNMYDTQMDARLKTLITETHQSVMLESMAVPEAIAKAEVALAADLGVSQKLTPQQIEEYVNTKITDVTDKMYAMGGLKTVYPSLFAGEVPFKSYEDPLLGSIKREADFVASVFNSETQPGAYGSYLPIQAVHKREMAWEALGSVRNVISVATFAYASLSRAVAKNSVNALTETRQGADPKTFGVLKGLFQRVQGFTQNTRKALLWVLDDLAIWDAINIHSAKLDELHELLVKHQKGFETVEAFTTTVKSTFTPGDGTDIVLSAARIIEYQKDLNEIREVLKERVSLIKSQFPNNKNATAPYENLIKDIDVAQAAVAQKVVKEISLATEPNMVSIFMKQVVTYSTATVLSVGGILYLISPEAFNAVAGLVGIHI